MREPAAVSAPARDGTDDRARAATAWAAAAARAQAARELTLLLGEANLVVVGELLVLLLLLVGDLLPLLGDLLLGARRRINLNAQVKRDARGEVGAARAHRWRWCAV